MSKSLKKLVEESREKNQPEVDMSDRGISNMLDINGLSSTADTCRQTQNPRRRIMTSQKRSAGNPW
uniref:Ras suppressor protein 1 n=1 Tax=Ictidomys tridecemlineatus TaxID=43179 RepID=A0A287D099_ICTTR